MGTFFSFPWFASIRVKPVKLSFLAIRTYPDRSLLGWVSPSHQLGRYGSDGRGWNDGRARKRRKSRKFQRRSRVRKGLDCGANPVPQIKNRHLSLWLWEIQRRYGMVSGYIQFLSGYPNHILLSLRWGLIDTRTCNYPDIKNLFLGCIFIVFEN